MTPSCSRSLSTLFPRFLSCLPMLRFYSRPKKLACKYSVTTWRYHIDTKQFLFSYHNQRVQVITVTVNFLQVGISIYLYRSFRLRTYPLILLSFDLSNLKSIGTISKPSDDNSLGKTRSTINIVRISRTVVDHWKGTRKRLKFAISRLSFEWTVEKAGEINRVRFG